MEKIVKKIFKSINGNEFLFQAKGDDESMHVLQAGYAVAPSGDVVVVYDSDSHSDIFSDYIHYYLDQKHVINYEILEAAKKMNQLNHIVYSGPKITDVTVNLTGKELCFLFIPDFENITDMQIKVIKELLESNKPKVAFNKNSQLIEMQIANISNQKGNSKYTLEQLNEFISDRENYKYK